MASKMNSKEYNYADRKDALNQLLDEALGLKILPLRNSSLSCDEDEDDENAEDEVALWARDVGLEVEHCFGWFAAWPDELGSYGCNLFLATDGNVYLQVCCAPLLHELVWEPEDESGKMSVERLRKMFPPEEPLGTPEPEEPLTEEEREQLKRFVPKPIECTPEFLAEYGLK